MPELIILSLSFKLWQDFSKHELSVILKKNQLKSLKKVKNLQILYDIYLNLAF